MAIRQVLHDADVDRVLAIQEPAASPISHSEQWQAFRFPSSIHFTIEIAPVGIACLVMRNQNSLIES